MTAILDIPGEKRRFVAGMYWRHEDRKPSRTSLLAGARKKDWWVVVRRTQNRTYQSGFCSPILNDKGRPILSRNTVSLAASIAEVLQEPWLGLFDLGNGQYWYIAVRDNYEILPDGDVIGDQDTVARIREEHASYGEWTVFVDGGIDKIAELVKKSKTTWTIRDIRKKPWVVPLVAGGTLLAGSIAGGIIWENHEKILREQRIAQERQRLAVLQAMRQREAAANLPWLKEPSPENFLNACDNAMEKIPLSSFGWPLAGLSCAVTPISPQNAILTLRAKWLRGDGATALQHPTGQLINHGNEIDGPIGVTERMRNDHDGILLSFASAKALLYGEGQSIGVKVLVSHAAGMQEHKQLPGEKAVTMPKTIGRPWQRLSVTIQGNGPTLLASGILWDRVPGLRLTQLNTQSGKNGGSVKIIGDLYVRSDSAPMPVKIPARINQHSTLLEKSND